MWNTFVGQLLSDVLIPALGTLVTIAIGYGVAYLANRIRHEKLAEVLIKVDESARVVVASMQQEIVGALKEKSDDGKLTPEEVAEVRAMAMARFKTLLGEQTLALLPLVTGNVEEYLRQKLEERLVALKTGMV